MSVGWYTYQELIDCKKLTEGDLLEFRRMKSGIHLYSHWAVYCGEDEDGEPFVIHLSDPDGDFGKEATQSDQTKVNQTLGSLNALPVPFSGGGANARVRVDKLKKVAGKDRLRINNFLDKDHSSLDREKIVQNARAELGKGDYHILKYNCEHFATGCRYDRQMSTQVDNVATAAKVVGAVGVGVVVGAIAYAIFSPTSKEKEKKVQERYV